MTWAESASSNSIAKNIYFKSFLNSHSHLTTRNCVNPSVSTTDPSQFRWRVFSAVMSAYMAVKTVQLHQSAAIQPQRDRQDRGTISDDRTMPIKSKYQKCESRVSTILLFYDLFKIFWARIFYKLRSHLEKANFSVLFKKNSWRLHFNWIEIEPNLIWTWFEL